MNMNKTALISSTLVLKAMRDKWGEDSKEYAAWKATFEIMDDQFNLIEVVKGMRDVAAEFNKEYARGWDEALSWVMKIAEGNGWHV